MWEREYRTKSHAQAKIPLREIARRKGEMKEAKEAKYDAADEINCRENVNGQLQGWHVLIGLAQFAARWLVLKI